VHETGFAHLAVSHFRTDSPLLQHGTDRPPHPFSSAWRESALRLPPSCGSVLTGVVGLRTIECKLMRKTANRRRPGDADSARPHLTLRAGATEATVPAKVFPGNRPLHSIWGPLQ